MFIDKLVFHSILELMRSKKIYNNRQMTYLNLRLGHGQLIGELGPLRAGQIFGLFKGLFEDINLVARKGGPRVFLILITALLLL